MVFETQEQAEACCRFWQKVLRLQDWNIILQIKRAHDFPSGADNRWGEIQPCPTSKEARLTLLDPLDNFDSWGSAQDQERTLVHELVHLHLNDFTPSSENVLGYQAMETAVELMANALVKLHRGEFATT